MKKERRIYSKKPLTFYSFSFGSSSFVLWSPFWYFKTTASSSLQCSPLHHPTCLIFIRCYPLCTKIANISIIICLFSSSSSWHSSPLPYSLSSSILDFFVILSLCPPSSSVVFLLILLRSDHIIIIFLNPFQHLILHPVSFNYLPLSPPTIHLFHLRFLLFLPSPLQSSFSSSSYFSSTYLSFLLFLSILSFPSPPSIHISASSRHDAILVCITRPPFDPPNSDPPPHSLPVSAVRRGCTSSSSSSSPRPDTGRTAAAEEDPPSLWQQRPSSLRNEPNGGRQLQPHSRSDHGHGQCTLVLM